MASDRFFTTSGLDDSLQSMYAAFSRGIPIVILSGDEGSGKTEFCSRIDKEASETYTSLLFSHISCSFEEVVRRVAVVLGVVASENKDEVDVEDLLEGVVAASIKTVKPLLLIFDGAEVMYLATLERVRKMLDRISADGGQLYLIFSGRKALLDHFDRLALCDLQVNETIHIEMQPLSFVETQRYLLTLAAECSDTDRELAFSPKEIELIFRRSGGNFRRLRQLVAEFAQKTGGQPPAEPLSRRLLPLQTDFIAWLRGSLYRPQIVLLGILAVVLLIFLALFYGLNDEDEEISIAQGEAGTPGIQTVDQKKEATVPDSDTPVSSIGEGENNTLNQAQHGEETVPENSVEESSGQDFPDDSIVVVQQGQEALQKSVEDGNGQETDTQETAKTEHLKQKPSGIPLEQSPVSPDLLEQTDDERSSDEDSSTHRRVDIAAIKTLPESVATEKIGIDLSKEDEERQEKVPEEDSQGTVGQDILTREAPENAAPETAAIDRQKKVEIQEAADEKETSGEAGIAVEEPVIEIAPEAASVESVEESAPSAPTQLSQEASVGQEGQLIERKTGKIVRKANGLIQLFPNAKTKRRPQNLSRTILEAVKVSENTTPSQKEGAEIPADQHNDAFVQQLYNKGVLAGSSWYTENDDKFTVQIMVLTSENAEDNVRQLLRRADYQTVADQFFILRKIAKVSTIFVFYGEYSTMAEARRAENSLPPFLRIHNPYAISVKGAMAKARRK